MGPPPLFAMLFILTVLQNIHFVFGSIQLYMHSGVQISQYNSFASVQILEYTVQDQTDKSEWAFTASIDNVKECPVRKVIVDLQQGGYPVINPRNETFPEHFNVKGRADVHFLTLKSDNVPAFYSVAQPQPGSWYAAVYLGDVDESMNVKDLSVACRYFIAANQRLTIVDDTEVIKVNSLVNTSLLSTSGIRNKYYRFEIPESAFMYQLTIQDCSCNDLNITNNSTCDLNVAVSGLALPNQKSDHLNFNCTSEVQSEPITINVTSPAAGAWNYLRAAVTSIDSDASLTFSIRVEDCVDAFGSSSASQDKDSDTEFKNDLGNTTSFNYTSEVSSHHLSLADANSVKSSSTCEILPQLGQFVSMGHSFTYRYTLHVGGMPFYNGFGIETGKPVVLKFYVRPMIDIGGTIKITVNLDEVQLGYYSDPVALNVCVRRHSVPIRNNHVWCSPSNKLVANTTDPSTRKAVMYIPYPESGAWYISMEPVCLATIITNHKGGHKSIEVPCKHNFTQMSYAIESAPCVDGSCANDGRCVEYLSGVHHFAVCKCTGGWRGYGCSDDSAVEPKWAQLRSILLLTLSNLAFAPAVVLAIYRRYFVEALVYFYTMFFSSFYHACDGNNQFVMCIMPYRVLQFSDFFGSILSFWVTLLALAKLPPQQKSLAFAVGALVIAMGVEWDKHSLWVFMIPSATALVIVGVSWCFQCYHQHKCYPGKRLWAFYLVPGALVAIVGLIIYAFLETNANYQFTHSSWHACMAVAILFILPPRDKKEAATFQSVSLLAEDTIATREVLVSS